VPGLVDTAIGVVPALDPEVMGGSLQRTTLSPGPRVPDAGRGYPHEKSVRRSGATPLTSAPARCRSPPRVRH
jgi:hypothetical protein